MKKNDERIEVKFNQTTGWPVAKANGPTFVLPIIALTPNLFLLTNKSRDSIFSQILFCTWSRGWQHKRRCQDNSRAAWCWTFHWSVTPRHSSGAGSSWPWWLCSPQTVSLSRKYLQRRNIVIMGQTHVFITRHCVEIYLKQYPYHCCKCVMRISWAALSPDSVGRALCRSGGRAPIWGQKHVTLSTHVRVVQPVRRSYGIARHLKLYSLLRC